MTDLHKDDVPAFQNLEPEWVDANEPLPPRLGTTRMRVIAGGAIGPAPEHGPLQTAYERRLERIGRVIEAVVEFIFCGLIMPLTVALIPVILIAVFETPTAKTLSEFFSPSVLVACTLTFLVYQAIFNVPIVLGWIDKRREQQREEVK